MFCSCPNRFGEELIRWSAGLHGLQGATGAEPRSDQTDRRAGLLTGCEIAKVSKFDRKAILPRHCPRTTRFRSTCRSANTASPDQRQQRAFRQRSSREVDRHPPASIWRRTSSKQPLRRTVRVDYNRAGATLMETVSRPDMRSDRSVSYDRAQRRSCSTVKSGCDMEKDPDTLRRQRFALQLVGAEVQHKIELKTSTVTRRPPCPWYKEIWRQAVRRKPGGSSVRRPCWLE